MADKRKGKKRKEDVDNDSITEDKPAKEEYKVAKWLKKNVPTKRTKFLYHNVEYFTGSKAIDGLLKDSPWADKMFHSRQDVADFLDTMLRHKFFHRARKVPASEQELLARKAKKKGDKPEEKIVEKKAQEEAESSHAEGKVEDNTQKEKKKRKIRLEMHMQQCFVDGLDAYVWIYDPIPLHYWIFGTLLVLGAIGICLFPLWPPEVRKGVYYLSIAGAGFLCFIIVMVVVRVIIFCLIWALTMGKHHLWLLPNLTEDVGFFASFWPLYHYEYKGKDEDEESRGKKKKGKKDKEKDSDQEEPDDEEDEEDGEDDNVSGGKEGSNGEENIPDENSTTGREDRSESESESSSEKSQTGKDFEMVGKEDVEDAANIESDPKSKS